MADLRNRVNLVSGIGGRGDNHPARYVISAYSPAL